MPLLEDLELELICLILEFINDTSPRTLMAVACVNKHFNTITKWTAHRHKVVNINGVIDDSVLDPIRSWTSSEDVLANIRTLAVTGWYEKYSEGPFTDSEGEGDERDDNSDELRHLLIELISNIGKLRRLDWSIAFRLPLDVLDAFETYQKTSTLRIFNFRRNCLRAREPDEVEERLSRSSALTHLRSAPKHLHGFNLVYAVLAVRKIASTAPNLEHVVLLRSDTEYYQESEQIEAHKPRWCLNHKPNSSIKRLTLEGPQISKLTLDDWSATVDLKNLQDLKFSRGTPTLDYFKHAATMLPNLQHLRLNLRSVRDERHSATKLELATAIQEYLKVCSPLQTLSIWSWMTIVSLSDLLKRHGTSLHSLHLHERDVCNQQGRDILSVEDVRAIRNKCLKLKSFTFDLHRTGARLSWKTDKNKAYYRELAQFKHLEDLEIYFDLGLDHLYGATYETEYNEDDSDSYGSNTDADDDSDDDDDDDVEENGECDIKQEGQGATADSGPSTTTLASSSVSNSNADGKNINNDTTTDTDAASTSSTSPLRPTKRLRANTNNTNNNISKPFTPARPSRDKYLIPYAQKIWSAVFGNSNTGPRRLDVKVGEWEARVTTDLIGHSERRLRRRLVVRPHERDDHHDAVVKVMRNYSM